MTLKGSVAQLGQGRGRTGSAPHSLVESALICEVITAQELCGFKLHTEREPPQCLAAVVIQGGGVDSLGELWVGDGGAKEAVAL